MKLFISRTQYLKGFCLILFVGTLLFFLQLGSTGLFDETPPLFAAASRGMSISGDWLTPKVNGLNRFDKPPLVYWFMGLFFSLPGQDVWDPLGTWAARLPSALSSLAMMLFLGDTLMKFPARDDQFPRRTAVITSLAFALSPLVLIWSRTAVSDALLCSTLGLSLILHWRNYVNNQKKFWYLSWIFLGLAVLTKGPVAIILSLLTFLCFGFIQNDYKNLMRRIRLFQGIFISFLISIPWYIAELIVEGKPFWDSFFGYHNFQRFTAVVNNHSAPWWFFIIMLVISSLPFTPFLLISIWEVIKSLVNRKNINLLEPEDSLNNFAFSWMLSVFMFFSLASTKLPSYWLPAIPAASILIGTASNKLNSCGLKKLISYILSTLICASIASILWLSSIWIELIDDPEMPSLPRDLLESGIHYRGALLFAIAAGIGFVFIFLNKSGSMIFMQIPLVFIQLFVMLPIWNLGDSLRQLPLRQVSNLVVSRQKEFEPIAMVGIRKPSVHFYTNKIIIYESEDKLALVNLSGRLTSETREGWEGKAINENKSSNSVLLVIDNKTSNYSHWRGLNPEEIGRFGVYKVWRIDRRILDERAEFLIDSGINPDWQLPKKERF